MSMENLRTWGAADGPGTQVRPGGSIVRQRNGCSDSEFEAQTSALILAFRVPGQIIPSIFAIIRLPTKFVWKIHAASPAALPEWSLTGMLFQAPPSFHWQMMVANITFSSFSGDRISF